MRLHHVKRTTVPYSAASTETTRLSNTRSYAASAGGIIH